MDYRSQQRPILTNFYNKMSAQELRWLCCIILRTMKIGATERTIFDLWHPDATKLFNKSSSLSRVCWELYRHDYRLPDAEKDISVFSCFQPQLAAFRKDNIEDSVKRFGGKAFYIEEKLDGERIQLHKSGDTFRYWSRKAKDYTYLYGAGYGTDADQEGGGLTKHLTSVFDKRVKQIVLDGEMITWNDKFDAPVGFGTLKSAANAEKNGTATSFDGHPFYCVFDVLNLNGKCLTNYNLRERRRVLESIIKPVLRRLEVVPVQEATKATEVEARLRECVATASEGLVVKDPDSAYVPNDRNETWIKVKPEYMAEFGENLDLLVIGGYWGEGRRGNRLSSFLCGLREDNPDGSGEPVPKFKTFARVGGGFNGPDYAQIDHITEGRWRKFDAKNPPFKFFTFALNRGGTVIEAPDMWIAPQDSFVVQLKAASSAPSDLFAAKVTLRFPRFEMLREDKDWKTATSLTDFISMQAQASLEQHEKQMNAHIRRKKAVQRKTKPMTILGAETVESGSADDALEALFNNMDFYVLTESNDLKRSRLEVESMIKAHGGNIVHSEGLPRNQPAPEPPKKLTTAQKRKRDAEDLEEIPEETRPWTETYIIAERKVVKVASLINRGLHDILKPLWVERCIAAGRVLAKEPRFMYHTTSFTESEFSETVDEYGDSYINELDMDGLKEILERMPDPELTSDAMREIEALKEDLKSMGEFPLWLFSSYHAYFDHSSEDNELSPAMQKAIEVWDLAGGKKTQDLHSDRITHVIVDTNDRLRISRLRSACSMKSKVPRIVSTEWVEESWHAKTILSEIRYPVR